jgi:hypothetical protein
MLKTESNGQFEAVFFTPLGLRYAHYYIQKFLGFDSTHTQSKYCITLLIYTGINANDQALPLA